LRGRKERRSVENSQETKKREEKKGLPSPMTCPRTQSRHEREARKGGAEANPWVTIKEKGGGNYLGPNTNQKEEGVLSGP